MQWLRSIVFTLFMAVWTIGFGFIYCVVCVFLPWRGRFWMAGMLDGEIVSTDGAWKFQTLRSSTLWSAPFPGGWAKVP